MLLCMGLPAGWALEQCLLLESAFIYLVEHFLADIPLFLAFALHLFSECQFRHKVHFLLEDILK